MKKIIFTIILAATITSFTACSGDTSSSKPYQDSVSSSSSSQTNSEKPDVSSEVSIGDTSGGEINGSQGVALKAVFGKVSSVAGNEVDLSLAKDPYEIDEENTSSGKDSGGMVAAVEMVPAAEGDTNEVVQTPKMELEYTGESKSMVIPTGVKINGKTGGTAGTEDIKKGSVIMILMDNDKISEISILE